MAEQRVPFVDLQTQYAMVAETVEPQILEILRTGDYIAGKATQQFEASFAKFCKAKHALGVGNGTDALLLAMAGLGVGPGKEVITVSHTFIATAEAVAHTGAKAVFIDVDAETGTMDPDLLEAAITEKTAAIIAVHLYGRPADMDAINAIANRHGIPVVEDAAQAQGAIYKGRRVGSLAKVACFSFYPSKNLGAGGDAGAVVTSDDELAAKMRLIANHGSSTKYVHDVVGVNSRMDSIQGAILNAKLTHIDDWNARRRALATEYQRLLKDVPGVRLPATDSEDYQGIHHLFAIRVENRDQLQKALGEQGIASAVHYPIGVHRQAAFATYNDQSLPVTEDWADNELSLPMFETMTNAQVQTVCTALKDCLVQA